MSSKRYVCILTIGTYLTGKIIIIKGAYSWDFPDSELVKNLPAIRAAREVCLISWLGRFHSLQSVQLLSRAQFFATPWTAVWQTSLSITNSQSLLKLMCIDSVMLSNHLILCHPLLLLHSIFPSIRLFSKDSVLCIRWPKNWRFSFSMSPSNEYSRLISLRTDWLHLLAVQGTLKNLLWHHSSKACFLYSPTLTSIHYYWENCNFD